MRRLGNRSKTSSLYRMADAARMAWAGLALPTGSAGSAIRRVTVWGNLERASESWGASLQMCVSSEMFMGSAPALPLVPVGRQCSPDRCQAECPCPSQFVKDTHWRPLLPMRRTGFSWGASSAAAVKLLFESAAPTSTLSCDSWFTVDTPLLPQKIACPLKYIKTTGFPQKIGCIASPAFSDPPVSHPQSRRGEIVSGEPMYVYEGASGATG